MERYTLINESFITWCDGYFSDSTMFNEELNLVTVLENYEDDNKTKTSISYLGWRLKAWCELRGYEMEYRKHSLVYFTVKRKDLEDFCNKCYYIEKSEDLAEQTDYLLLRCSKERTWKIRWRNLAIGVILLYFINSILHFIL